MVGYLPSLCSWWGRGWSRDEWGWNLRVGGVMEAVVRAV